MAAIDSLLALMDAQQATGIVMRIREAPVLIGGKGRGLTMPPISRLTLDTFLTEVLTEAEQAQLQGSGACDTVYRSSEAGNFSVEARANGDSLSLKLRRAAVGMAKPAVVAAPPAPVAGPAAPPTVASPPSAPPTVAPPLVAPAEGQGSGGSHDPVEAALASRLAGAIARASSDEISDILVSSGQPLWIRCATGLTAASSAVVDESEIRAFVHTLLDARRLAQLESAGSVDAPWVAPPVDDEAGQRFRLNVFRQSNGLAVALRPIGRRAPRLADLALPASVASLAGAANGMVLVVGPTGAGKSTTAAAIVEQANQTRAGHVITLEDPIELIYQSQRCLIHQREVGTHVESFADGLRAALRECPDIILVGEMRDRETAALALTAAETGHLVLSTLHSGSAAMAIDRIVDIFPESQQAQIRLQLAGSLRAVLTQQLLPGARPGTRHAAVELLTVNYAVGALIREGKNHQLATQIQTGRDDGMMTFEASLFELVRSGRVRRETALAAARDPAELQRRLG